MGRYYSRHDGVLYIYVTKNDPMADLSLFPPELELFDPDEPMKVNERMAIITGAAEADVDKTEIILSLNGFMKRDHPREVLEYYFVIGDDSVFQGNHTGQEDAESKEAEMPAESREMDVIIPKATSPTRGYASDNHKDVKDEDEEPIREMRKPLEFVAEGRDADRDLRPASEEELIDSLVLWMRSQGFQIEEEREPSEIETPRRGRKDTHDEKSAGDELVELLSETLKAKAPPQPTPQAESSLDELLRQISSYVKSITPRPQEMETPKTALDELIDEFTQLVSSRTPAPVEAETPSPSTEELIIQISDYLRSQAAETTPAIQRRHSIEEELDRHIVEYVKSRLPIRGSDVGETRGPPSNELHRQLTMLRWNEQVAPLKTEGKTKFPEEVLKLLGERLKKEKQES